MIKAVLFDFDGVIVQSEPLHKKTFLDLLAPYGVEASRERWYREFAGTGSRRIFQALAQEYGIDVDIEELVERRRKTFIEHAKRGELKEMPGLRPFLERLRERGIKTAIVSGGHRSYIEILLDMLGIGHHFDYIVSADEIKARKPDPEPFLMAARELGASPGECLVIEDSYSGCEAARKAGMRLIWIRADASMEAPECDLEVLDLLDGRIDGLLG
jgi:HAD superfamily hydrolase (TIGR01509 family)